MYPYLRYATLAVVVVAGAGALRAMEAVSPAEYPARATSGTLITAEMLFPKEFSSQPNLIAPSVTMSVIISPALSVAYALDPAAQPNETPFMVPRTQSIVLAQRAEPVARAIERTPRKQVVRRAARTEKFRMSSTRAIAQQPVQRCHGLFDCMSVSTYAFQSTAPATVELNDRL
jgi:hypothetical protein